MTIGTPHFYLVNSNIFRILGIIIENNIMKIKNWSKLVGERIHISGAALVFVNATTIEADNKYLVNIADTDSHENIFDLTLTELNGTEMNLSIVANQNHFAGGLNGTKRVMRKSELKNLDVFVSIISNELMTNKLFNIYAQLINSIQDANAFMQKKKAVAVNPLNFNQPNSSSIQW